jgi:hypothetical protein
MFSKSLTKYFKGFGSRFTELIKLLIKPTRPSGHAEAHLVKLGD